MSKFNEILNSSNPSDALLGEQIDALEQKMFKLKIYENVTVTTVANKWTTLIPATDMPDNRKVASVVFRGISVATSDAYNFAYRLNTGALEIKSDVAQSMTVGVNVLYSE